MAVWSKKIEGDVLEVVDVGSEGASYLYVNLVTWLRTTTGLPNGTPYVPCSLAAREFIEKYYLQCELPKNYFDPLLTK